MRILLFISILFLSIGAVAQTDPPTAIRNLMANQQDAWNRGDLVAFMKGYWQSDSLMFIGSKGIVYGYDNTLKRYQTSYSSLEQMGKLRFDILHINRLDENAYLVVGKFYLTRTVGDLSGIFTLTFRRINGEWVITSDHTG
ncbi:MAG TPA: nuclear transport factor 2 family protein [Flavihumibacter sp.]|nr:nuclear transport factor 2 family protein [Bacteroidota bacterium]HOA37785.1 nuclear transport factor 2 family protein [Flavihumibacter sp.]HPZ87422.1 nuclear transport factor 2 family protein [Flavihumibacter sp.]HQD10723.1 nuclear transport factor 2 family protein [Flavihumibacter sp.]